MRPTEAAIASTSRALRTGGGQGIASTAVRLRNLLVLLRGQLWPMPLALSLGGLALAYLALVHGGALSGLVLESGHAPWWLFSGDPGTARDLLSSLLSGLMTMTSLVVSVTFVILSLAANQLGPRLIPTFMADRQIQAVLGLFIGTILYIVVVLRSISDVAGASSVPHTAVTGASLLTVLCLFALLFYVHKVARSLVADNIIDLVAGELQRSVRTILPEADNPADASRPEHLAPVTQEIAIGRSGVVQVVDHQALLEAACKAGVVFEVRVRAGHFVLCHGPHLLVRGGTLADDQVEEVRSAFVVGPDRSPAQDIEFGLRQLVEIGLRALSPGINDPFTAIATIDRLAGALEVAMSRGEPAAVLSDKDGAVRVLLDRSDPAGLVAAAFDALRQAGQANTAILIRMADVIGQLAGARPSPPWSDALSRQLARISDTARQGALVAADLADLNRRVQRAAEALGEGRDGGRAGSRTDGPRERMGWG
jgi:uncharacterized membrane protein